MFKVYIVLARAEIRCTSIDDSSVNVFFQVLEGDQKLLIPDLSFSLFEKRRLR